MTDEGDDHAGLIAPPPVLYIGTLGLGLLLDAAFNLSLGAGLLLRSAPAGLLLLTGVLLARWSFVTLRRHETSGNPRTATRQLVSDGPFAHSRNPIYLAQNLLFLGIAFLGNGLVPQLLLPLLLAVMHHGVIRREERYLAARFGPPYLDYCRRVRRWL